MRRARLVGLALACVVIAAALVASAGEKEESKVVLTWDQFKNITGWDGKVAPGEILIPWPEVQKMLDIRLAGMAGAKVKLSWKDFRALVEWSVARSKEDKLPPPADYVITKAAYTGSLSKDVATFDVAMEVSVLRTKGWKRVVLLPATVGVNEATLPKDSYLNVRGNMYELLTQATGVLDVKLSFAATVTEDGGMNSVTFERVPSGTCLLDLAIADKKDGVKVTVAGAQAIKPPAGAKGTVFALPAGNRVAISWEREIKEIKKGPPKLYAQTQTLVAVGDGLVTCREKIVYSIVHAGVRELSLNVPTGVNILDVRCSYLHDWRAEGQTLKLQLEREVKGIHYVDLTYEKAAAEAGGTVDTPVISTADTERERGFVAVIALANVEISGTPKDGASAVDSSTLPPELLGLTPQPVLLAYRYVGNKFAVPLQITKHEDVKVLVTIVDAATFTVMQTPDGRRITSVVYDVRNNRNQFLRVKMPGDPKDCEIWSVSVSGRSARPAVDKAGMTLIPLIRSTGQHLTAFPVEIIYVEKGVKPPAGGKGKIRIDLPKCTQPIMHLMCNLYLPKVGRYKSFAGPLKVVEDFKQLRTQALEGRQVRIRRAEKQAAQIQSAVDEQLRRTARPGVTPIKVNLPTSGTKFKLQKILVLDEDLWIELDYTHWPGYKKRGFLGIF